MAFCKMPVERGIGMKISSSQLYLAMALFLLFSSIPGLSMDPITSYKEYCRDIVEDKEYQGGVSSSRNISDSHLGFHRAFFTGGSPFFDSNAAQISFRRSRQSAFLAIRNTTLNIQKEKPVIVVDASLLLRNRSLLWVPDRPRVFRHSRSRRDPFLRPGGVRITLKGVWSPDSGTLCMAGCVVQDYNNSQSHASDCKVKAVFHYPRNNTIHQPLVKGTVQSMRDTSDPSFFKPMTIVAIYEAPFVFNEDSETAGIIANTHSNVPWHINVWKEDNAVCHFPWSARSLDVIWDKQCTVQDCSPFKAVGPTTISTLTVENLICSGGKVYGFLIFSNLLHMPAEGLFSEVLAIEGVWSSSKGQLTAWGCHLDGVTDSSLVFDSKDCDIVITLQFPITLELTFRYTVTGRVARKVGSSLKLFKPFLFTGRLDNSYAWTRWDRSSHQIEYAYTAEKIMLARSMCQSDSPGQPMRSKIGKKKLNFPDGQNFGDLGFPAKFKVSSSSNLEAQFSPLSINQRINMDFDPRMEVVASSIASHEKGTLNVSFDINLFNLELHDKFLQNISSNILSAEGVYDPDKGLLSLIACRSLVISKDHGVLKLNDGDQDCEMHINLFLPPTNAGYFDKHQGNGQISSLRDQKDALFFSPVGVTSGPMFYHWQAANALMQIDFEVLMGMISLTMAALFIGLQLHHVKKHPKVLPQISLLMLFILILGNLIPLILNFEAIFVRTYPQNILQWSGGWLEINEVIVRVITMVVFLMLIRLLYLSWDSKCQPVASAGPWYMEKNLFRVCLITYGLAGLSAMIIYGVKGSNFLDILKGFSGLIIDFFLFPQVAGNYVWKIHDRILSCPFYLGMTFVRALPHVYDIVRKLEFFLIRERRYYFANPSWDFYSNVWDVMIPCGGLVLAILVFCQQKYGGSFFSVATWRQRRVYSQVSMNPI